MKQPLNKDDQKALVTACRDDTDKLLLFGLLDTGIRIREWCEISGWRSLDAIRNGSLMVGAVGSTYRVVPVTPRLSIALSKHYQSEPIGGNMPLKARAAEYRLRELRKFAGVRKRVTPATIRLTFVANAIEAGIPEHAIRTILGSWPKSMQRLAEKLGVDPIKAFKKKRR